MYAYIDRYIYMYMYTYLPTYMYMYMIFRCTDVYVAAWRAFLLAVVYIYIYIRVGRW